MGISQIPSMKLVHALASSLASLALADSPVSCPYSASHGTWEVSIGTKGNDQSIVGQCNIRDLGEVTSTQKFRLSEKSEVVNLDTGSKGSYTIVSSQGFEISIDGRKYWAYYHFECDGPKCTSDCSRTMVGYQRDELQKTWSCIQMQNLDTMNSASRFVSHKNKPQISPFEKNRAYRRDDEYLTKLAEQASFSVKHYPEFEQYSLGEMQAPIGHGEAPERKNIKLPLEARVAAAKAFKMPAGLPDAFDWTNVDGKNFDSPVWDQSGCGSCFAFASKSLMESRFRVMTNNKDQPIFSVQEMITCGMKDEYNQGCSGGFGYLVGGKGATEMGFVEESCGSAFTYNYNDKSCPDTSACTRWYSTDYEYVGGFYGGATIEMMMSELVANGPLNVGIYVAGDFLSYAGGVYYETDVSVSSEWNPLVPTNHAVVVVGYGRCPESLVENDPSGCNIGQEGWPYWKVKNSWGSSWGEGGYFRVLLGVDEIAVESKPFAAMPVGQF